MEPAATPGALACLYQASCVRCGAAYPGPFRVPPTPARQRPALTVTCAAGLAAVHDMEPWHGIDADDLDPPVFSLIHSHCRRRLPDGDSGGPALPQT